MGARARRRRRTRACRARGGGGCGRAVRERPRACAGARSQEVHSRAGGGGCRVVYKVVAMMQRWKELLKEGDRGQVDKWKEVILENLARLRQLCDPPEDI
uniref:Uncharacterized protein n=1 Tax=Oryza sativa subsp. japonica TaxID=39947 RepID=Q6YX86_ORYSJ|nr:hypothetical protein [Oryza sativa Japonica Group]